MTTGDGRPKNMTPADHRRLWSTFSQAIGAELRESRTIKGATGLDHPTLGIAVDDKNKRVIVYSSETNARVAALMQGDIQATMPDVSVLVSRPITVDLAAIVRTFFPPSTEANVNVPVLLEQMTNFNALKKEDQSQVLEQTVQAYLKNPLMALSHSLIPPIGQIVDVLQQAAQLDWDRIVSSMSEGGAKVVSLEKLRQYDTIAVDRDHGVCAIPLYEFGEKDWELFFSGTRIEDARQRLQDLNIHQYFFPAPDHLALGLADKGIQDATKIVEIVRSAPSVGHPLGASELVSPGAALTDLLDQLGERGLVVEGELGMEVTDKGRYERSIIKFRPRESLLAKLINRLNITAKVEASTKDLKNIL